MFPVSNVTYVPGLYRVPANQPMKQTTSPP
jgi:hypothetical protein